MKKKILHIAYSGSGGQPNVALTLANYGNNFDKEYINIILFSGVEALHKNNEMQCIENKIPFYFLLKKQGFDLLFFVRLFKLVLKIKPNYIIAHSNSYQILLFLSSFFTKIKIIAIEHHSILLRNKISDIRTVLALLTSKKLVVLTEKAKSFFLIKFSIFKNKFHVINNGIFKIKEKKNKKIDGFQIGVASRITEGKDIDTIIEAFEILDHNSFNLKLNIAGDGENFEKLKTRVTNSKFSNKISLLGSLSKNEMNDFYNNINIFIASTAGEGFGLTIVEASSIGIPCIGSDVAGINTIITHKKNGLLFEYKNKLDLKNCIELLISDENLYHNISIEAKNNFISNYTINKSFDKYKELINML